MGLYARITGNDLQLEPEVTKSGVKPIDSDVNEVNDVAWNDEPVDVTVAVDYSDAFQTFSNAFYDYATDLVPVDTGYLLSSIQTECDGWSMTARATAPYAQYVQYGTYKMAPQSFFEPALDKALQKAQGEFEKAVQDAKDEAQDIAASMGLNDISTARVGGDGSGSMTGGNFLQGLFMALIQAIVNGIMQGLASVAQQIAQGEGGNQSMSQYVEIT